MKSGLIAWIWLVTCFDIWCCQWLTLETELNPLAKAVMSFGGVWFLVSCKVFGTYLATELLKILPAFYTYIISIFMFALLLVLAG